MGYAGIGRRVQDQHALIDRAVQSFGKQRSEHRSAPFIESVCLDDITMRTRIVPVKCRGYCPFLAKLANSEQSVMITFVSAVHSMKMFSYYTELFSCFHRVYMVYFFCDKK